MRKIAYLAPFVAAGALTSCVPPNYYASSFVNLDPIPVTRVMSVDEAEKVIDEKMGVIGWSKAPKAYEQAKNNQYNICAVSGQTNSQVRFANVIKTNFVATSARGHASFFFAQAGKDCPAQLIVSEITRADAENLASAISVLAVAERNGTRQSSAEPDRDQWNKISTSEDPADFQSFILTYPSSPLAEQAYGRLIVSRQAITNARAAKGRKMAPIPLQPPATGLVMDSTQKFGKAGKTSGTITTRTRVVSGSLSNYVEETTSVNDTTTTDGSRVHSTTKMTYRGPYGLLSRTGTTSGNSSVNMTLGTGGTSKSGSTTESRRENINGDSNSLFPLKTGNLSRERYISSVSTTTSSEVNLGAQIVLGGVVRNPPTSHKSRSEHEQACIVEDQKKIDIGGSITDTVKIFCASRFWIDINNNKSITYMFSDNYYSPKVHAIVRSIMSTTSSPEVTETDFTVVANPG